MKLASAQINSKVGDIIGNLDKHYEVIELAAQEGVQLILFPEMSITGDCRAEGPDLAMSPDDERLDQLKALANTFHLIIVAGASIVVDDKFYIGSFIFKPETEVELYIKQYLHDGEELYYESSFTYDPIIELEDERIGLAICADITHEQHFKKAYDRNCTIYAASIFYSKKGMQEGLEVLSSGAKSYSMDVLMSNYSGMTWNIEAGGSSALWNKTGIKESTLNTKKEGLLIAEKVEGAWVTKLVETQH